MIEDSHRMSTTFVPQPAARPAGPALFRQGLRPFFLLAGLWAVLAIVALVAACTAPGCRRGRCRRRAGMGTRCWRLIGAASRLVLTAIPNWTGGPAYRGAPLMLVAALFLRGPACAAPGSPVPAGPAAVVALLPLPALLLLVAPALVRRHAAAVRPAGADPGLLGR